MTFTGLTKSNYTRSNRTQNRSTSRRTPVETNQLKLKRVVLNPTRKHFNTFAKYQPKPQLNEHHVTQFLRGRTPQYTKFRLQNKFNSSNESNNSNELSICKYKERLDEQAKIVIEHERIIKRLMETFKKIKKFYKKQLYNERNGIHPKTNNKTSKTNNET
uniref:Uncharacterized protein n=1 Tax=viral metagenome TaxID=1070528 RepID=A0A6C0ET85_9ZZZZ